MECTSCKLRKRLIDFNFRNKALNKRQKTCRLCTRAHIRLHYKKNTTYYLEKAARRNAIVKNELRLLVWSYLNSHPCVDCGENDPLVLEFDHMRDKKMNIANMIKNSASPVKIRSEIRKCLVRCANCHRRKTAGDFGWNKLKFASVAQLD